PVYRGDGVDAVRIATESIQNAVDRLCDVVIVDTAGRLQIDEEMMAEAVDIKNAVKPDQILMVVDAMTGQDIVNVVRTFAERVDFDGVIMSKLDGDTRGGGALSVREVTGKPIKFVSQGEKPDSLEVFHPDRMAKRILGMGDVVGIIEQAQKVADEQDIANAERMLREGFTMDDMLDQMNQIRKMGGLSKLVGMIPGGDRALAQMGGNLDESQITRIEALIHSMTPEERAQPKKINGQRRKRIAAGSGRSVQEVNQLLKQWSEMNKMMGKMTAMANEMGGKGGSRKARRQMQSMMRNMGMGKPGKGRLPVLRPLDGRVFPSMLRQSSRAGRFFRICRPFAKLAWREACPPMPIARATPWAPMPLRLLRACFTSGPPLRRRPRRC
ncbi:MAG: signal recognition particle protein, partial [Atopobiaceae bacterium]|nr:signal recognition particle protein [Atopobiaceae bacterium]